MRAHDDLDAQIAQRLFGWMYEGGTAWEPAFARAHGTSMKYLPRRACPAYSTDPTATAQVWFWLETTGSMQDVTFHYHDPPSEVGCHLTYTLSEGTDFHWVFCAGATWPEALCRAALALAEALEEA